MFIWTVTNTSPAPELSRRITCDNGLGGRLSALPQEFDSMRSQIVTTSRDRPGIWSQIVTTSQRYRRSDSLPVAFTEQGVAMLPGVLRSSRAVEVNIAIRRTFVQLRRLMDTNRDLARKIDALERKYDEQFSVVFVVIKELIAPPPPLRKTIGFHP
jgi:hypothetical protein